MVLCTGQVTAETNVPMMSASMMTSKMMFYPTTVPFILNGSFPFGSNAVGRNAEEPFVFVSDLMKPFNYN